MKYKNYNNKKFSKYYLIGNFSPVPILNIIINGFELVYLFSIVIIYIILYYYIFVRKLYLRITYLI